MSKHQNISERKNKQTWRSTSKLNQQSRLCKNVQMTLWPTPCKFEPSTAIIVISLSANHSNTGNVVSLFYVTKQSSPWWYNLSTNKMLICAIFRHYIYMWPFSQWAGLIDWNSDLCLLLSYNSTNLTVMPLFHFHCHYFWWHISITVASIYMDT